MYQTPFGHSKILSTYLIIQINWTKIPVYLHKGRERGFTKASKLTFHKAHMDVARIRTTTFSFLAISEKDKTKKFSK